VPTWNSPWSRATGQPPPDRCRCWLVDGGLQGRGIGHGASRTIDQTRAMATSLPFPQATRCTTRSESSWRRSKKRHRSLARA
jgi:hypothetical protein